MLNNRITCWAIVVACCLVVIAGIIVNLPDAIDATLITVFCR